MAVTDKSLEAFHPERPKVFELDSQTGTILPMGWLPKPAVIEDKYRLPATPTYLFYEGDC